MTATRMPWSTPNRTTPTVAMTDSTTALRGPAGSGAAPPRSMSDSAAAMTTAASAVCGRSASSDGKASSSNRTTPAPTTPVSWLLAPDCSATAVREPLVEMANPPNSPAAMFDAPMPTISWSASTSSPRRAAKLVAVAIVSVERHERDADRGQQQGADIGHAGPGDRRCRHALGECAGDLHTLGRQVEPGGHDGRADDGDEHGGDLRGESAEGRAGRRARRGPARAWWCRSSRGCVRNWRTSSTKPSASVEKPNSFGS